MLRSYFVDDFNSDLIPITFNDDSSADDNLDDDTLGSLYRFQVAQTGQHTLGVDGFDPDDQATTCW